MPFPPLDQYNEAVQHPQLAFSDPALKAGKVKCNPFSIPIALGGGFVITYSVQSQGKRYAVRCFHRQAGDLQKQYAAIGSALKSANLPFFVGFEYQSRGILVNGEQYPIVKMDWIEGETLGMFIEQAYNNRAQLTRLVSQFRSLEEALAKYGIAHGDLQNGNVIVDTGIKLIDYDGVYVPPLPEGKGYELGHKHFQHPKRLATNFGPKLDRFSFIVIDLSLRALMEQPGLFKTFSTGENILFSASDFLDPSTAPVFGEVRRISGLKRDVENFARVCLAESNIVPSLRDFLAGSGIPAIVVRPPAAKPDPTLQQPAYIGAFDVVNASDFTAVRRQIGNRIELVGKIVEVKTDHTRHGKPYVFINFGPWKGRVAKITIWSEGLLKLQQRPTESWVGQWISVTGVVDPIYRSRKYKYEHVGITVEGSNQLRMIGEADAKRRLTSVNGSGRSTHGDSNRAVLDEIRGARGSGSSATRSASQSTRRPSRHQTSNQQILEKIQRTSPTRSPTSPPSLGRTSGPSHGARTAATSSSGGIPWWVWVVGILVLLVAFG